MRRSATPVGESLRCDVDYICRLGDPVEGVQPARIAIAAVGLRAACDRHLQDVLVDVKHDRDTVLARQRGDEPVINSAIAAENHRVRRERREQRCDRCFRRDPAHFRSHPVKRLLVNTCQGGGRGLP